MFVIFKRTCGGLLHPIWIIEYIIWCYWFGSWHSQNPEAVMSRYNSHFIKISHLFLNYTQPNVIALSYFFWKSSISQKFLKTSSFLSLTNIVAITYICMLIMVFYIMEWFPIKESVFSGFKPGVTSEHEDTAIIRLLMIKEIIIDKEEVNS